MRQQGFTLIEAMVAGVISTLLAGSVLSVLYMGRDVISSGTGYARLNQFQVVASTQIDQTVRGANVVKIGTDRYDTLVSAAVLAIEPVRRGEKEIVLTGVLGDTLGGYRIRAGSSPGNLGYLDEVDTSTSPNSWKAFRIGTDTVRLIEPASSFSVWPRRRGVEFRLAYAALDGNDTLSLALLTERVYCRNQSR